MSDRSSDLFQDRSVSEIESSFSEFFHPGNPGDPLDHGLDRSQSITPTTEENVSTPRTPTFPLGDTPRSPISLLGDTSRTPTPRLGDTTRTPTPRLGDTTRTPTPRLGDTATAPFTGDLLVHTSLPWTLGDKIHSKYLLESPRKGGSRSPREPASSASTPGGGARTTTGPGARAAGPTSASPKKTRSLDSSPRKAAAAVVSGTPSQIGGAGSPGTKLLTEVSHANNNNSAKRPKHSAGPPAALGIKKRIPLNRTHSTESEHKSADKLLVDSPGKHSNVPESHSLIINQNLADFPINTATNKYPGRKSANNKESPPPPPRRQTYGKPALSPPTPALRSRSDGGERTRSAASGSPGGDRQKKHAGEKVIRSTCTEQDERLGMPDLQKTRGDNLRTRHVTSVTISDDNSAIHPTACHEQGTKDPSAISPTSQSRLLGTTAPARPTAAPVKSDSGTDTTPTSYRAPAKFRPADRLQQQLQQPALSVFQDSSLDDSCKNLDSLTSDIGSSRLSESEIKAKSKEIFQPDQTGAASVLSQSASPPQQQQQLCDTLSAAPPQQQQLCDKLIQEEAEVCARNILLMRSQLSDTTVSSDMPSELMRLPSVADKSDFLIGSKDDFSLELDATQGSCATDPESFLMESSEGRNMLLDNLTVNDENLIVPMDLTETEALNNQRLLDYLSVIEEVTETSSVSSNPSARIAAKSKAEKKRLLKLAGSGACDREDFSLLEAAELSLLEADRSRTINQSNLKDAKPNLPSEYINTTATASSRTASTSAAPGKAFNPAVNHKPKIVHQASSSPRENNLVPKRALSKFGNRLESLPSRSTPSTPRDSDSERSERRSRFVKKNPRIVSKRYIRSSPPRETPDKPGSGPATAAVDPASAKDITRSMDNSPNVYCTPIHTRTGLTLTQNQSAADRRNRMRSSSSFDLVAKTDSKRMTASNPGSLDRSRSMSHLGSGSTSSRSRSRSASVGRKLSIRTPDYSHVESKVKQYIQNINNKEEENQRGKLRQKSKSCGNLSPIKRDGTDSFEKLARSSQTLRLKPAKSYGNLNARLPSSGPLKAARSSSNLNSGSGGWRRDSLSTAASQDNLYEVHHHNPAFRPISGGRGRRPPPRRPQSKSIPNLAAQASMMRDFSKSAVSLTHDDFEMMFDPEDSDYEAKAQYFSRDNLNDVVIDTDDLLNMVYQERKGKQEAKRVLDELKSNYEDLLQKFAAAENALDVVRFGGRPPAADSNREETFQSAEMVISRLSKYKTEDNEDLSVILTGGKVKEMTGAPSGASLDMTEIQKDALDVLNQAIGLEMAVHSGILSPREAGQGIDDLNSTLDNILQKQLESVEDLETRDLLKDASRKLEEIKNKLQIPDQGRADDGQPDFQHKPDEPSHQTLQKKGGEEKDSSPLMEVIEKVERWRKGLSVEGQQVDSKPQILESSISSRVPQTSSCRTLQSDSCRSRRQLPSCYSSLPSSPAPSNDVGTTSALLPGSSKLDPTSGSPNGPLDLDSGCHGSDRSTLWPSSLQQKGLSPKSKVGSGENVITPLYNLEEEGRYSGGQSGSTTHRSAACSLSEIKDTSMKTSQLDASDPADSLPYHQELQDQHAVKTHALMSSAGGHQAPQKIVSMDNRYVSSVVIEKGIRLSPRAVEAMEKDHQAKAAGGAKTQNKAAGAKTQAKSFRPTSDDQRYLMFEQDLNDKEFPENLTSTPNRKSPMFPMSGMKRSTAMYDLKSAAAGQPTQQQPISGTELRLTDLTASASDDEVLGLSDTFDEESQAVDHHQQQYCPPSRKSARKLPHPPGDKNILAAQIDNEILELRNFFEDHREEMMSLLHEPEMSKLRMTGGGHHARASGGGGHRGPPPPRAPGHFGESESWGGVYHRDSGYLTKSRSVANISARRSDDGLSRLDDLPNRFSSLQLRGESESEAERTLQLRRIEFEKRRMRKELKKRRRRRQHQQQQRSTASLSSDQQHAVDEEEAMLDLRLGGGSARRPEETGWVSGGHGDQGRSGGYRRRSSVGHQVGWDGDAFGNLLSKERSAFGHQMDRESGAFGNQMNKDRARRQLDYSKRYPNYSDEESSYPSLPNPEVHDQLFHQPPQPPAEERLEVEVGGDTRHMNWNAVNLTSEAERTLEHQEDREESDLCLPGEQDGEWSNEVPMLDLEDIWSDVTIPSYSIDCSIHSPRSRQSHPATIPEENDYKTSMNISLKKSSSSFAECKTSRSVGCNTETVQHLDPWLSVEGRPVTYDSDASMPSRRGETVRICRPPSSNDAGGLLSARRSVDPTTSTRSQVILVSPSRSANLRRTVSNVELRKDDTVADVGGSGNRHVHIGAGGTSIGAAAGKVEVKHNGWVDDYAKMMAHRGEGQVIIINQNHCDHTDGASSRLSEQHLRGEQQHHLRGEQRRRKRSSSSSKRRKKQDLTSVLKSLDAANDLAQRLKTRSEQMLDLLSTEISTLHRDLDAPSGS